MNYFLLKSEPNCYSIDMLKSDKKTSWTGVRNYQARNILRDSMKQGDMCFFYHSNCCQNTWIVWLMRVASDALPDMTALDVTNEHFDEKSTLQKPIWITREMDFVEKFDTMLSLKSIKEHPLLCDMIVAQKWSRLSVQTVSQKHFDLLMTLVK
jgi:predicted RNA-binding protein with PUA-like domain